MKIVIAVDGSKYGQWAVEWANRLALRKPERITALHVVDLTALATPLVPRPAPAWDAPFIKQETARLEAQARVVVKATKRLLAGAKPAGRVLIEHGSAASKILEHAKSAGTLVVLGSRGLDALDRFMLGSVSTKVVQHAAGPVLVVKEPPRTIRRIVLATDGSKASDKALQFLLRHYRAENRGAASCEVAVLHAMPLLRYPELKEAGHEVVERAAAKLNEAGYRVEPVFKIGYPADEILKFADRRKSDLIVTGARGRGVIARFLLGSVSTKLVQYSRCSTLIVR
ncbi:universal stress protein [Nitrospira sp.]|nr:universal stress protein [Nitrospira sp.]